MRIINVTEFNKTTNNDTNKPKNQVNAVGAKKKKNRQINCNICRNIQEGQFQEETLQVLHENWESDRLKVSHTSRECKKEQGKEGTTNSAPTKETEKANRVKVYDYRDEAERMRDLANSIDLGEGPMPVNLIS